MFGSESEFVRWLSAHARGRGAGLRLGIGDDSALVRPRPGFETILTTDLSIEGVHYVRALHPPRAVGHRALARALSDVAAMGGRPRFALLSLAVSSDVSRHWVEEFYAGLLALARRESVRLIGGDTAVVAGRGFADVVVVGEVAVGRALLRSGARPGDHIYVSGRLGLSALGLELLKSKRRRGLNAAVRAHLFPAPRVALGQFLAERRLASALMDLSDGLSLDLARLCQASGVGAQLRAECIPRAGFGGARRSLERALHGGEDYELLFTVPGHKISQMPASFRGVPLHSVGRMVAARGISLELPDGTRSTLAPQGYDHFRKQVP